MENDESTTAATIDTMAVGTADGDAQDTPNSANGGTADVAAKPDKDERWKGLKGNKNSQTRGGLWSLNRKRQAGLPVDRRTRWGKIERQIQALLTQEYGGAEKISTRTAILISLVGLDCARLYEHKRSRRIYIEQGQKRIRKAGIAKGWSPEAIKKAVSLYGKSPKDLSVLDGYMSPVISSLRTNLTALGPEPERQEEKLQDILAKIANENGGDGGDDDNEKA